MNCVTKSLLFSTFSLTNTINWKKMNKRKLAVQYFGRSRTYLEDCLWLAGKTNRDCHITMLLSLKTMEVQIKRGLWNKRFRTVQVYWIFRMFSPRRYCRYRLVLRCPLSLPGALFLRFVLFSLRRCGVACPGRSALAQAVSELQVSSFRHAAWLNFVGFRSSGDFFAYRILLSTIICHIAVLLLLVVAVSCLEFWRFWETIRVTVVCWHSTQFRDQIQQPVRLVW